MTPAQRSTSTPPPSHWVEMLRGGDRILIRPIHAGDLGTERKFIEDLSPELPRSHFLDSRQSSGNALLRQMTAINLLSDVAYVAVIDDGFHDRHIGVGRFTVVPGTDDCEFAVAVADRWRKKGVGTHLMHHLVNAARAMGLERMYSRDASNNELMRRFAAHLALEHRRDPDDATQVVYSLRLQHPAGQFHD